MVAILLCSEEFFRSHWTTLDKGQAVTASAKFKSPRMGTFVLEASNVPAHIACEIRRVWHASHTAASDLVKRWQASSFLHRLE